MYLLNKIGITSYNRIHLGKDDKRLTYCVNRGLIYAITQIGRYYGNDKKTSPYKNGISYLKSYLEKQNIHVSKNEIRTAMRPNRKKKHEIKVSTSIREVIIGVVSIIDISQSTPYYKCAEMNNHYAQKKKVTYLGCYQFLVGNLIDQLDAIHKAINKDTPLWLIYQDLEGNRKKCVCPI